MDAVAAKHHDLPGREGAAPAISFLLYTLAGCRARRIGTLRVSRVLAVLPATAVGASSSFFKGMVVVNGARVPVLDMRMRFKTPVEPSVETVIVVAEVMGRAVRAVVGIMLDAFC